MPLPARSRTVAYRMWLARKPTRRPASRAGATQAARAVTRRAPSTVISLALAASVMAILASCTSAASAPRSSNPASAAVRRVVGERRQYMGKFVEDARCV